VTESLVKIIADEKQSDVARITSARQLVEFEPGNNAFLESLLEAVNPRSSPQLSVGIIDALGASEATELANAMLKRFAGWSPGARATAIRVLLSRPQTARVLVERIDKGEVGITELTLDQKQALANHSDRQIAALAKAILARGGGLPSADRQKVIDEWMVTTKKTGTVANGKEMFKKHCAVCHQINGEGNKVGPDLTGMAVHPKSELIIHILDPNRSVEGNFRLYKVATLSGKNYEGLLASETKTSVELIDAQGKKQVILREDIEQLAATTKSLMPEGFEKQMKQEDFTDLLEFLTQKGKYVPIPLDKVATIGTTKGMFYDENSTIETMVFPDWKPKIFDGIPFVLVDPQEGKTPNAILLYGPNGKFPPTMPRAVTLPCNTAAKAIHLLSGVSGWGSTGGDRRTVSMIVRLHYDDGKTEDHELIDGQHFADYIRKIDVPKSKLAFMMRGQQQIRYLAIVPKRDTLISQIEFRKGNDRTAPIVMAVTVETK
jgi:putative heme-binding domain-containing protein